MFGLVNSSGILLAKSNIYPEYKEGSERQLSGWYINSELIEGAIAAIEDVPNEAITGVWQLTGGVFEPIPADAALPGYVEEIFITVNDLSARVEELEHISSGQE